VLRVDNIGLPISDRFGRRFAESIHILLALSNRKVPISYGTQGMGSEAGEVEGQARFIPTDLVVRREQDRSHIEGEINLLLMRRGDYERIMTLLGQFAGDILSIDAGATPLQREVVCEQDSHNLSFQIWLSSSLVREGANAYWD
jgi:hypothetical protein